MASDKKEAFLGIFRDLLEKERVAEKARAYYVRHLERWGGAFRQRPAGMAKKDFLEGYLRELSHTAGVEPFMVYQAVEAVRLAHEVLLGEEWAQEVDWEGLRSEYRTDRFEVQGEVVAETLDKLRDGWKAAGFSEEKVESLAALVRVMREGNYALRTEESYLQWVVRLMSRGGREGGLLGCAGGMACFTDIASLEVGIGRE